MSHRFAHGLAHASALAALAALGLLHCMSEAVVDGAPGSDPSADADSTGTDDPDGGGSKSPPPGCPKTGAMTVAGKVAASAVSETSGIAASARNPGTFW